MKKSLLLILLPFLNFSQEIKIHKYDSESEKIIYEYYENDNLERIKNGKFEYFSNNILSITGFYKENKACGIWKFKSQIEKGSQYLSNGEIVDDKKNGKWQFSKLDLDNKKTETYFLDFKRDTIINLNINTSTFNIKTDSNANIVGEMKFVYYDSEYIIETYKNVIIKFIKRDIRTGDISSKYNPNKRVICKKIDSISSNLKLNKLLYKSSHNCEYLYKLNKFSEIFTTEEELKYYENLACDFDDFVGFTDDYFYRYHHLFEFDHKFNKTNRYFPTLFNLPYILINN
ncbi:hypothetical protein B0A78_08620 [Flavobacterium columnare NBRC 100251 = ATCC 23463]|uniref:hypothetical protein n=1 Tax=Flavobacterium columnare TaxID=996 RepID=UPI000BEA8EB2|nr:hypothetical protein [Flavobacterium columnare]PDS23670.1 hypothetical protein B0A78_08620 [Flavobacterium columnare NBRC 100251 = ATCC 23463]GEM59272.1 hypothetical protein FC1_25100 [Flavobacterium columnare NBRC 100251 = ATCC 23463]